MRQNKIEFRKILRQEQSNNNACAFLCNQELDTIEKELDSLDCGLYELDCNVTYGKTIDELRWESEQDFLASILYDFED